MSHIYILEIRQNVLELAAQAKNNDPAGLAAKKMLKELSSEQKKIVWQIFYAHEIKQNPLVIKEICTKLSTLRDPNVSNQYARKHNCFLKVVRAYKNKFKHRMSNQEFIESINHYHPRHPLTEIEMDELLKSLPRPTLQISVEILDHLCTFIYNKSIYKQEGFLRIPGNIHRSKEFKLALLQFHQDWKRSPTLTEIETITQSINDLHPSDVATVFKGFMNDLPLMAGIESHEIEADHKFDLPAKCLNKYPKVKANLSKLLQAIINEQEITKFNAHGLRNAFPAARSFIISPKK